VILDSLGPAGYWQRWSTFDAEAFSSQITVLADRVFSNAELAARTERSLAGGFVPEGKLNSRLCRGGQRLGSVK
jgi:hypothetical protein